MRKFLLLAKTFGWFALKTFGWFALYGTDNTWRWVARRERTPISVRVVNRMVSSEVSRMGLPPRYAETANRMLAAAQRGSAKRKATK